jgi:hypothetical protein
MSLVMVAPLDAFWRRSPTMSMELRRFTKMDAAGLLIRYKTMIIGYYVAQDTG